MSFTPEVELQVHTDGRLDIAEVARRTEGYSGADLQAIVSESQLASVLQFLAKAKEAEAAEDGHGSVTADLDTPVVAYEVSHLAARMYLVSRCAMVTSLCFNDCEGACLHLTYTVAPVVSGVTSNACVQHVLSTLDKSRPSLSAGDREDMYARYKKFMRAREGSARSPFSKETEAAKKNVTDSMQSMRVAMG